MANIRSDANALYRDMRAEHERVLKRCQTARRKAKRETEKRLREMAKRTPGIHVKRQAQPDLCHPLA